MLFLTRSAAPDGSVSLLIQQLVRHYYIHEVNLLKKVRLEIAVNEDFVEPTVKAIIEGAKTGKIGDGKIFVVDLPECIRIRTGERGEKAIG